MRALVADARPSAALAAYDDLAGRLREELGTAPDRGTAAVHLAILREDSLPAEDRPRAEAGRAVLMGRDDELAAAQAAWAEVGADQDGHLLLVEGEAGIGKTRLLDAVADFAAATGGRVLRGRCHPAERSLFLQPYVDALRPALLDAPPARLSALVRDHEASWVALVPELGAVLPVPPRSRATSTSSAARRTTRCSPSCAGWPSTSPSCWSSTTSRTAARRRSTCWGTSPPGSARRRCWCWPPCGPRTSRPSTDSPTGPGGSGSAPCPARPWTRSPPRPASAPTASR